MTDYSKQKKELGDKLIEMIDASNLPNLEIADLLGEIFLVNLVVTEIEDLEVARELVDNLKSYTLDELSKKGWE